MPDNPAKPRRWFQYRLSTWFVLVAILAWAIVQKPYMVNVRQDVSELEVQNIAKRRAGKPLPHDRVYEDRDESGAMRYSVLRPEANPTLLYPALALVAFVGWKVAWLIVERRRKRPTTSLS